MVHDEHSVHRRPEMIRLSAHDQCPVLVARWMGSTVDVDVVDGEGTAVSGRRARARRRALGAYPRPPQHTHIGGGDTRASAVAGVPCAPVPPVRCRATHPAPDAVPQPGS